MIPLARGVRDNEAWVSDSDLDASPEPGKACLAAGAGEASFGRLLGRLSRNTLEYSLSLGT